MLRKFNLLAAIAAAASVSPAFAQNSEFYHTVSAMDASEMLGELGVKTELRQVDGSGSPALIATTDGGAKFLVAFFDCGDPSKSVACNQTMVSTAQAGAGVDFEDLNNFNGQASVTTVVYEPSNQLLIFGRNIFSPGGVGRDNFKLQVQLFLSDMQNFVEQRRSNAKSVAFAKTPELKSKISSISDEATPQSAHSIIMGANSTTDVEIAINNSLDVDYSAAKK